MIGYLLGEPDLILWCFHSPDPAVTWRSIDHPLAHLAIRRPIYNPITNTKHQLGLYKRHIVCGSSYLSDHTVLLRIRNYRYRGLVSIR